MRLLLLLIVGIAVAFAVAGLLLAWMDYQDFLDKEDR